MAKFELEGNLVGLERDNDRGNSWTLLQIDGKLLADIVAGEFPASYEDWDTDYGRCRITIEQLPPDMSPEAVAKRVVARHRGALDILEEIG